MTKRERAIEPTLNSPTPPGMAEAGSTARAPTFRAPAAGLPANKTPASLAPGQRIDDFELLRILGEGAFGKVFLARQISLDRQVALKVTANWGNEARTLASLEHDYIVHVFSEMVDAHSNLRLLCMQYVPGTTLQEIIRRLEGRPRSNLTGKAILDALDSLSTPTAFHPAALRDRELLADADFIEAVCVLGERLAEALDYAHREGVLHRDIKPANILVTPYGRPMLTDFNLSLNTQLAADTRSDVCGGTLAYMAPEHLDAFNPDEATSAEAVDRRSDIYSLGVVLYELLTGRRPFCSSLPVDSFTGELRELASQRRAGAPSPDFPEAPELLSAIIRRCLDPDPERRYQTGAELARALDGCLELRRIERELPKPRGVMRIVLRQPFLWLAIGTLLPQLLGSLVNTSYNWMQIVGYWDQEQRARFLRFVAFYNVLVYPACVATMIWLLAPPFRVWRALTHKLPCDNAWVTAARRRALSLPTWAVILSCLGWLPGGIIFPVGIHLMHPGSSPIHAAVWVHFLISFTISGLIALTYSYFAIQMVVLRELYPRFWVSPSGVREKIAEELAAHRPRLWLFQLLAGVIPLAGAVLLVGVGPEVSGDRLFRLLAITLILLGMAGFGLAVLANSFLTQTIAVLTRKGVAAHYRPLPGENTTWK